MGASATNRRPLIATPAGNPGLPGSRASRLASLALVAAASLIAFWPTLGNGFLQLGFDDAIIVDTPALRGLDWANLKAMFGDFNHAHYTPLTMLSLAVDYRLWGLDPFGYHLTNVLLHAVTAALACAFLWSIAPSARSAVLAALIFAVHPLQLEAVALAIQRKTVLSGAFFFLTLILYRRWLVSRRPAVYAAALAAFVAAALAKPIVVTLPLLLLLIDYAFVGGRPRLADKLPFCAVAGATTAAAAAAHAAIGVTHGPHGGSVLAHVLMTARVGSEYVAAVLLPLGLSPVYYYPRDSAYAALTILAALAFAALLTVALRRRRTRPWTFFCAAWFAIALLPESNLFPLAQLRADRFLYLPILGIALWIAIGIDRLPSLVVSGRTWRPSHFASSAVGAALVIALALLSRGSAPLWKSDVSAWQRVADRHRWAATAQLMLGRAWAEAGNDPEAERAFAIALGLNDRVAETHLELALLYERGGRRGDAEASVLHFLELAPGDRRGEDLLARLRGSSAVGDRSDQTGD